MKIKNAFTLAEVMIVVVVLGILAALIIPAVMQTQPNTKKVMLRKAYNTLETTIKSLSEDATAYPNAYDDNDKGFLDNEDRPVNADPIRAGKKKLCYLFAGRLSLVGRVTCMGEDPINFKSDPSFVTSDGIAWYFGGGFDHSYNNKAAMMISVDVNNVRGPNSENPPKADDTDRFSFFLREDGKIIIPSQAAIKILASPNKLR